MAKNKYQREIKPGVFVNVYDVLKAFNVHFPVMAHGKRGVKWFSSQNLGDVLHQAFVVHKVACVKRCIRYMGVWYVKA